MPVPGDGSYEWEGFIPILELPHVADPPRGWFSSANQDNLPPGYPFAVGFQWTDPFRFARIEEVLGSGRRFTLADMMQLQQDELSLPARSLVPLLRGLKPGDGSTAQAIDQLLSWDFVLHRDSVAAAIYVAWELALKAAVWNLVVPAEAKTVFPEPQPFVREDDRVADGARQPLRSRSCRRPRRDPEPISHTSAARARATPGPRQKPLALRSGFI